MAKYQIPARKFGGYHPRPEAQKAIEEFEEAIGQPIRDYLREQAARGYGVRAIGEAIGLSYKQCQALLAHHGIKTTGSVRPIVAGKPNIRLTVKRLGLGRDIEERVRHRMEAGMSLAQALAHSKINMVGKSIKKAMSK